MTEVFEREYPEVPVSDAIIQARLLSIKGHCIAQQAPDEWQCCPRLPVIMNKTRVKYLADFHTSCSNSGRYIPVFSCFTVV